MKILPQALAGLVLLVIYAAAVLLVNPVGEFPLNDDWAFAKSVWKLANEGKFTMVDWPAMTLTAQVVWGALFCKIFGTSFLALRISSMVSALVGAWITYRLGLGLTRNQWLSLLAAVVLLFNPLYFSLSLTFMTEVHFQAALLLAFYFFVQHLRDQQWGHLVWGTVFSVVATLIRQPGLLVPLVFVAVGLVQHRRLRAAVYLVPLGISVAALVLHNDWLRSHVDPPPPLSTFTDLFSGIWNHTLDQYVARGAAVTMYSGLFLLPLVLWLLPDLTSMWRRRPFVVSLLGVTLFLVQLRGSPSYPVGNIFYNLGLGPELLKDTFNRLHATSGIPQYAWKIGLTGWSSLCSTALLLLLGSRVWLVVRRWRFDDPLWLTRLGLILILVVYSIFLLLSPGFFDRYAVPFIGFTALLLLPDGLSYPAWSRAVGLSSLVFMALFSIAGTHDYLAWNRARWRAVDYLMNDLNVSPTRFDAGFETNAWLEAGPLDRVERYGKSWWFVTDDEYVVAFGQREPYPRVAAFPFDRWLSFGPDSLHVYRQLMPYSAYPIRIDMDAVSEDGRYFFSKRYAFPFPAEGGVQSDERAHSGRYSMRLGPASRFALSTYFRDVKPGERFTMRVWRSGDPQAGMVLSADGAADLYRLKTDTSVRGENGWELLELRVVIPDKVGVDKVGIYLWNGGSQDVWFDDFKISRQPAE